MAKILVIDDEKDVRWILTTILQGAGYEVIAVDSGHRAFIEIESSPPDVILCDLRMPGIDGLEILRRVKVIDPKVPIIMLTGYGSTESAVQSMKSGAFDYMSKPFNNEKLLDLVREAIAYTEMNRKEGGVLRKQLVEKLRPDKTGASEAERPDSIEEVFESVDETDRGLKEEPPVEPSLKTRRISRRFRFIGAILLGVFIIITGVGLQSIFRQDKYYVAPSANISGLVWAGAEFWASDWFAQNIYRLKMDDSITVLETFHHTEVRPTALAWDGSNLWSYDGWAKKICRHNMDELLSVDKVYDVPSEYISGITWDGRNIWTCDTLGNIYKHRMDDKLSVIISYDVQPNAAGIIGTQEYIWTAHSDSNKIYKYRCNENGIETVAIYMPSVYLVSEYSISGIAWDGHGFWTVSEEARRIFNHNMFRMKIKKLFGK